MPSLPYQFLDVDGCTVAVAGLTAPSPGSGTLVWLHGLGAASTTTFADVAQHPSLASISSILIDLPGAGHSRAPESWGGTIEDLASVSLRAIETVVNGPVVLFGHSLGGSVAIVAATQRPDLIRHLIVAEPNLDPGIGTISQTITRRGEEAFATHGFQGLVEATSRLARQGNVGAAAWLRTLRLADPRQLHRAATSVLAARQPTFRQQLIDLPLPVTIIAGQLTPPIQPPLPYQSHLTGYVVPDAGHQMFTDNPAAFVAILTEILAHTTD